MNEIPTSVVVAAFDEEDAADGAYEQLKLARKAGQVGYAEAAVVRRDESERLHVKEPGDIKAEQGALAGALSGAILGLIAGPAGLVAGGIVGAFAGAGMSAADTGISDEQLAELGRALAPGTSAIIVLGQDADLPGLDALLTPLAAEVFTAMGITSLGEQLAEAEVDATERQDKPGEDN